MYSNDGGIEGVETDTHEAIKWYRAAAEDGEPGAQKILGDLYWEGESVDQDDEEAIKWYRASADSESYGVGRVALGRCYDLGRGVETDKEKAFKLYMEALEIDEDLEYEVADPLAVMYAQGKGVNQDFDEARKWFYRAQDEDTELWNCLQMMFDSAEHQDVMDWVQAGVDRGDPEFVHALGACYWTGTSVEEDNYLALKLTFEAVKSGYEPAKVDLFEIIFFLHGEENFTLNEPEEFDELEKYLRSLAEGGDPEAAYALGNFYWANWHGKENPELAFKWFKTVGEQPDARPKWKYQLGYCYQEGYGVKENPEDAFKWFLQSAEDGFYLAIEVVSECYREGIGVDKNLEEAEKWTLKQKH